MELRPLLYIILAVIVLTPAFQMGVLELRRQRARRRLGRARGSHVLTLVHRLETLAVAGLPVVRFAMLEQGSELVGAIDALPPDVPIDLVLHVPQGVSSGSAAIAAALARRTAPVTVIVPYYALSDTAALLAAGRPVIAASAGLASEAQVGALAERPPSLPGDRSREDGQTREDEDLLRAAAGLLIHYAQAPLQRPALVLVPLPAAQRAPLDD